MSMEESTEFKKNLKGVKALLDSAAGNLLNLPDCYIAPPPFRALPSSCESANHPQIPVINLADLHSSGRAQVIQEIADACGTWGFFQVINHGVPSSVMAGIMQAVQQFFDLPFEEKEYLYSNDPLRQVKFSTSFNPEGESFLQWRDYLRHPVVPAQMELWPHKPLCYRDATKLYAEHMNTLASYLMDAISEGLGLPPNHIAEIFSPHRLIQLANYYPPSPNPDLTIGNKAHSDVGGITILLQNNVSGLQVRHNGQWVPIKPTPDALVINLGDQLQILTNGKYKSIEHCATSTLQCRISIATFLHPSLESLIAPIPCLIDESHKPIYKPVVYGEYLKNFLSSDQSHSYIDTYKMDPDY